jgi:hypothetical protein
MANSTVITIDPRYRQIEVVLNAMQSENSKRAYRRALTDFIDCIRSRSNRP